MIPWPPPPLPPPVNGSTPVPPPLTMLCLVFDFAYQTLPVEGWNLPPRAQSDAVMRAVCAVCRCLQPGCRGVRQLNQAGPHAGVYLASIGRWWRSAVSMSRHCCARWMRRMVLMTSPPRPMTRWPARAGQGGPANERRHDFTVIFDFGALCRPRTMWGYPRRKLLQNYPRLCHCIRDPARQGRGRYLLQPRWQSGKGARPYKARFGPLSPRATLRSAPAFIAASHHAHHAHHAMTVSRSVPMSDFTTRPRPWSTSRSASRRHGWPRAAAVIDRSRGRMRGCVRQSQAPGFFIARTRPSCYNF